MIKKLILTLALLSAPVVVHAEEQKVKDASTQLPQKTFDAAVNALTPAYCSLDISSRISKSIDVVRDCYNNTREASPENDICVFEDSILKALVDTYRYRLDQIGDDDPTAGIKFISRYSIATRYANKVHNFHIKNLTSKQKLHYFDDRVYESFDVLNERCKKLRQ
ncbi:unnamed protein product [Commensalibacter communis]|uniref:Uncharacterized protein n=1 Tax=Commensalibacter communis TaxID=2972786 RepID=A0A9W4TRN4_9PROT|nr:hypothetical protein [Commensalibacter communis]CAI3956618.1 unnamed protein product [Commensalibacter communis]CAI3958126.1 unnamed protein product [Commensalibacter communis]CAI3959672.1 unnamed protein product [Commensalibacter communis]CAI3959720.1 unnamed protein product [Commensalibacter communis]